MHLIPFYVTTMLLWFVLYGPQPILPVFAAQYGQSESMTALLVTATLFPLAVAPLVYGMFLESLSLTRVLRWAVLILAGFSLLFGVTDSFPLLVGIRFAQGLLLPAALTAIMAYISTNTPKEQLQRSMSLYVTATIIGGLLARVVSGVVAEFDWRYYFIALAFLLVGSYLHLGRVSGGAEGKRPVPTLKQVRMVLTRPATMSVLTTIFCVFFVFQGVLNYLPFRVQELYADAPPSLIGFMYTGYLMGAGASLSATRLVRRIGSPTLAVLVGLVMYALSCVLLGLPDVRVLFAVIFLLCGGMFFVHTVSVARVNRQEPELRGVVNGFYVSFYYGGGVVGSYLPGLVFEQYGWNAFLAVLLGALCIGVVSAVASHIFWNEERV